MRTYSNILSRYKRALPIVLATGGIIGLLLLISGSIGYWRCARSNTAVRHLDRRLAAISADGDHQTNIDKLRDISAEAEKLGIVLPEAEYARQWHQWQIAVEDFKRITAALNNRYLATGQQRELQSFHTGLLDLRDSCAATLETGKQPGPDLGWKLHNLKGNVSVMLAYSVLAFEQDGRKAAKFLSDAIDDYKKSIELIDGICSTPTERAVPRWNMELIVGMGEYRRIGLSEVPRENMAEVREQLEAFIPDVAGFAPGVPLETRVEK
jgi:hypothetical protein